MLIRCVRSFWYDGLMRLVGDVWFEDNYQALLNAGNVVPDSFQPVIKPWILAIPFGPLPPSGP